MIIQIVCSGAGPEDRYGDAELIAKWKLATTLLEQSLGVLADTRRLLAEADAALIDGNGILSVTQFEAISARHKARTGGEK